MNSSLNKILKSSKPNFYSFIKKLKYRRLSQPGYTRYSYDDIGDTTNELNSRLTHKSNAEELISKIPVIEVEDNIAICYGVHDFGWGHPVEFITLNTKNTETPSVCKYCGMRYVMKAHH